MNEMTAEFEWHGHETATELPHDDDAVDDGWEMKMKLRMSPQRRKETNKIN